jgi:hypothetical protein
MDAYIKSLKTKEYLGLLEFIFIKFEKINLSQNNKKNTMQLETLQWIQESLSRLESVLTTKPWSFLLSQNSEIVKPNGSAT